MKIGWIGKAVNTITKQTMDIFGPLVEGMTDNEKVGTYEDALRYIYEQPEELCLKAVRKYPRALRHVTNQTEKNCSENGSLHIFNYWSLLSIGLSAA